MNLTVDLCIDCECPWLPTSDFIQGCLQEALRSSAYRRDCEISLRFVDASESRRLNLAYRQQDKATNVLSFPAEYPEAVSRQSSLNPLGDLVICPTILETEARQQGKDREAHLAHLLVHGGLHLLGYTHDDTGPAAEMEALEINALQKLGFPNPYLIG